MKYKIFNVDKIRVKALKEFSKMDSGSRLIGERLLESVLDHQRVANERHNSAMLEKDIVIAGLNAKIEILEQRK